MGNKGKNILIMINIIMLIIEMSACSGFSSKDLPDETSSENTLYADAEFADSLSEDEVSGDVVSGDLTSKDSASDSLNYNDSVSDSLNYNDSVSKDLITGNGIEAYLTSISENGLYADEDYILYYFQKNGDVAITDGEKLLSGSYEILEKSDGYYLIMNIRNETDYMESDEMDYMEYDDKDFDSDYIYEFKIDKISEDELLIKDLASKELINLYRTKLDAEE